MRRQKSEWLVALTQTEIMFILASVILILLLAERSHFEAERAAAKEAAQEQAEAAEAAKEITHTLRRAGLIPESAADSRLAPDRQAAGAVRRLVEEKQEINRVLRRAGEKAPSSSAEPPQVRRLQAAAAQAGAELKRIRAENEEMKREMENLEQRLAQRGDSEAALTRRVRAQQGEISRLRVGFTPCWPRADGTPPYYFAYRVTYDKARGRFRIAAHPHLQSGAPVVAAALAGDLAIAGRPPQGWLGRAELAAFGARLRAAKNRVHGEECRLAAQINDAGQAAIEFIRDQTVLFPVYE